MNEHITLGHREELTKRFIENGQVPFSLFKYKTIDKFTEEIFTKKEIYFPSRGKLNDPFEYNISLKVNKPEDIRRFYDHLVNENPDVNINSPAIQSHMGNPQKFYLDHISAFNIALNNNGIFCLTEDDLSILMWSYYGNSHNGIVIEFDTRKEVLFWSSLFKIDYDESRFEIDICQVSDSHDPIIANGDKILKTKFSGWAHEKEWRILKSGEPDSTYKYNDIKLIKSVTFGCRVSATDQENFIKLLRKNQFYHVLLFRCHEEKAGFLLRKTQISYP